MPFSCCAMGSHARTGETMAMGGSLRCERSGIRAVSPVIVLFRLSCQTRRTRRSTGGTKVCRTWQPGEPVGDAQAFQALRAQPNHEVGPHCLEFACGAEACPCSHRPRLVPVNDGRL